MNRHLSAIFFQEGASVQALAQSIAGDDAVTSSDMRGFMRWETRISAS